VRSVLAKMKFPLIIDEHGDVSLYWSLEELKSDIEPIDIENGEYVAYDADGKNLRLDAHSDRIVKVVIDENVPINLNNVTIALKRFIAARTVCSDIAELSASRLIRYIEVNRLKN